MAPPWAPRGFCTYLEEGSRWPPAESGMINDKGKNSPNLWLECNSSF